MAVVFMLLGLAGLLGYWYREYVSKPRAAFLKRCAAIEHECVADEMRRNHANRRLPRPAPLPPVAEFVSDHANECGCSVCHYINSRG